MKIAFLGYDFFFACFELLMERGHEIHSVYSFPCDRNVNFNDRLANAARQAKAPFILTQITGANLQQLLADGCELLLSAGYPYRIPVESSPALRGCNIHPTLLPEGRGPWPLPYLILKNRPKGGVTIHKLSVEFDAGPILCQEDIPLTALDNLETISCRSQMLSAKLLDKLLSNFEEAWRNAKPQGTGTWWKMPTWGDRTISWNSTVNEIDRVARAFGKFDSLATFAGKDWVVRDLSVWQEKHNFEPGSVVHRTNREVVVAASDGFACLRFYDIDPDWKKIDAEARM